MQKSVKDFVSSDTGKTYTRNYTYDGENILFEFDGCNALLARHTHNPLTLDDVLSTQYLSTAVSAGVVQSSGNYYYHKDHLGSVIAISDSSGNVKQRYNYSSFGKILSISDGSNTDISNTPAIKSSFTYTGREYEEEASLYYYRARWYSPATGRFLQQDPEPGKVQNPLSMINSYIYVQNNPVMNTDPTGKFLFAFLFAFAATAITSGSVMGALAAVGATFLGSLAASGFYSAITGKWGDFWKNAESIYNVSAAFLGFSAIAGHFWGGGIQQVGANSWYQGMVGSKTNVGGFFGGDLTIGTSAYFGGSYQSILSHSLGHSFQFIGLTGALGPSNGGAAYLGFRSTWHNVLW